MTANNKQQGNDIGFILPAIKATIDFISRFSAKILLFKSGQDFQGDIYVSGKQSKTIHRSDTMNLVWFTISILIYTVINLTLDSNCSNWYRLLLIPIILRQINIVSWILRPIFVEPHNNNSSNLINITSYQRNLLYAFIHYVELIVLFGSIYSLYHQSIFTDKAQVDCFTYLYYSGVSQLTIGYGDIAPRDFIRFVVILQALIGLIIFAVTVGTIIGKVTIKDEANNNISK